MVSARAYDDLWDELIAEREKSKILIDMLLMCGVGQASIDLALSVKKDEE